MRRILLAVMSTIAAVVLLFGYRTSTPTPAISAPTTVAAGAGAESSTEGGGIPAAPGSADTSITVVGDAAQTRWGPVQVQLTVAGGEITAVDLLQVPAENGRDVQINNVAVPILVDETLQAQSADIDSVSGATVTSDGYLTSLQSALDQAGL